MKLKKAKKKKKRIVKLGSSMEVGIRVMEADSSASV